MRMRIGGSIWRNMIGLLGELSGWRGWLTTVAAVTVLLLFNSTIRAETGGLSIELNKLEPAAHGCRAYFVITNQSSTAYDVFKLDLVLFQTDGVIARRFAIDLGPVKPDKRSVKLFDIDAIPCEQVGSLLINDVLECKSEPGPTPDCLAEITPSSLTKAQLTK
jgi:hypothetical protein